MKKSFRMFPPLMKDIGRTIVRMESDQMALLGITSGDAVRVSWTKTTGAICLPLEPGFKQPNDPEITYMPNTLNLPQARLSDIVSTNSGNEGDGLVQVEIEKTDSAVAKKVTLVSFDSTFEKDLDKARLEGLLVCKNNRLNLHDVKGWHSSFEVIDVQPDGLAVIDKNTKLEFLNNFPQERSICFPKLNQINQVIPLAKQVNTEFVTITMPSLEIYNDGFRAHVYVRGKYGSLHFGSCGFHMSVPGAIVKDNLGNFYNVFRNGGGGFSSQNEFSYDWQLYGLPIDPHAKELVITIKEILFQGMFPPPPPTEPPLMTEFRYSLDAKMPPFLIISGPWEFKIRLK